MIDARSPLAESQIFIGFQGDSQSSDAIGRPKMLSEICPLVEAGFAVHYLHPREKRPIGNDWQNTPVASLDDLRRTHRPGYNSGVRLGEASLLTGGVYLLVFDIDIRIPDLADEAWARMRALLPNVDIDSLPSVQSGSMGESRHIYFVTDKPFFGKKLAVSEGKHRRWSASAGKEVWGFDWEIELFGTGKQVVLPPSIHPDTGLPYVWERPFDFLALDLGAGPFISAATIEALGVAETSTYEFEAREPLTFSPGQLERDLDALSVDRIDDRTDWVILGQALHHQFGGSLEGFELWMKHSARGKKFLADSSRAKELRRYRGFGRNRRKPVTMATVRLWAQEARHASLMDQFDEEPDEFEDLIGTPRAVDPTPATDDADEFAFIDSSSPAPAPADPEAGDVDTTGVPWMSLLDLSEEGAVKPTLHNVEIIAKNDARLRGLAQINEFTQETVQRTPPGQKPSRRRNPTKATRQLTGRVWDVDDELNGDLWSDDRDFAIRSIIEAPKTQGGYGIKVSDRDLKAGIVLAANEHAFHPVREYLNGLAWDGTPRVEALFVTYVGAPDDAYSRHVARLMLLGAVTRIFEPGHKFDFAVILEGIQGKRKSTFIEILGKRWFAELDGDLHNPKEMIEIMQGSWIMEIPELSGFQRADVRALKAFISRRTDRARLAYARRAGAFPRQCIFIGSTNDKEYLKDDTGGRRFWPMACSIHEIDSDALERNIDQIWAEATSLYRGMRARQPGGTLPLYLTDPEARQQAALLQESRRIESADDGLAGQILDWLDRPINSGNLDDDTDAAGIALYRDVTCLLEIWCECLGKERGSYGQASAQMLGRAMRLISSWGLASSRTRIGTYGLQRVYARGGDAAYRRKHGV